MSGRSCYDIDNINKHLETKELEGIRKESKGRLVIPNGLSDTDLQEEKDYFFSQDDRISIISFLIFFNITSLNLNQLAATFMVSRTTLKNDLSLIESDMKKKGFIIEYYQGYKLIGNETNILNERVRLFREYIEYFDLEEGFSDSYHRFLLSEINKSLDQVDIFEISEWTKTLLKQIGWMLNDDSYYWYLANIYVFTWYVKNKVENPLKGYEFNVCSIV